MNSAVMMFEKTSSLYPDKIAVSDEWGEISFSELRLSSLSIGTALLNDGSYQTPVIVYLPKSIKALTCFLGAMYSGNPYVPVDANIPMSRLQSILANMGVGHIITCAEMAANLEEIDLMDVQLHIFEEIAAATPDEQKCMKKVSRVIDSDPIYIMYTSGSTGVPKGVTIPHRGIIDYAEWLRETFSFDENTILGNQSAFYFDNSTFDIFTMCRTGAKLVIIPEALFRFPGKLPEFLAANLVNTIFWVPTVMMAVANSGILGKCKMPELKKVLFCGEEMPNRHLNIWRRAFPDIMYANLYGPTEITDVCSYYVVDREFADSDPLPIGIACKNMRIIILRDDGTEANRGETGELCVLGSALSRGYWRAPDITRKAFTQNPLNKNYDDRLYHTGDLAYVQEDGNIIFIGRADSQIKLRGNRIELGEIEIAAKSLPAIMNACVLFDAESQEIVLFAETTENLVLRKVNMELRKLLPSYMLPGKLECMDKLPLTPNGKVDRVLLKSTFNKKDGNI